MVCSDYRWLGRHDVRQRGLPAAEAIGALEGRLTLTMFPWNSSFPPNLKVWFPLTQVTLAMLSTNAVLVARPGGPSGSSPRRYRWRPVKRGNVAGRWNGLIIVLCPHGS